MVKNVKNGFLGHLKLKKQTVQTDEGTTERSLHSFPPRSQLVIRRITVYHSGALEIVLKQLSTHMFSGVDFYI